MLAVALAVISAALFGAMTVALRFALRRNGDADMGALVTIAAAAVVAVVAAVAAGSAFEWRDLAVFAAAGLIAPGGSQLLFTMAVRDAGASRASVVVGTAPLFAVAIAFALLDEPVKAGLVVGAVLIVAGGIALALERTRPQHFRTAGLLFAVACTLLFATRDNFVRWFSGEATVASFAAAAATLVGGGAVVAVYTAVARRARPRPSGPIAPVIVVGLLFGLSYVSLFAAYYRGRVSVVAPIVATESLWGVGLSALLMRSAEVVGRRLVLGALLIVAGGILIGAFR